MAYILGTSGHVDHGKTALIKKLTGIETSHLPEEKKRGMTIELGFASLQDFELGTIGIVDVPGHERFIRNMVAGTWGLDASMLVVAADDGWMQMTTDHLRVLKAMKIDSIVAVITKSDLADSDTIELLKEEISIQSIKILGKPLPVISVSALTGAGINELKCYITSMLRGSHKVKPDKSFLYIDRVFTLKGIGTTITGTLRGRSVSVGSYLELYPGKVPCRVKSIQSHHQDLQEISEGSRTALNLKLPEKVSISRGMLLSSSEGTPVMEGSELLIRIDEFFYDEGEINTFKNHTELEIALGSTHAIGKLHLNSFDNSLGRLSLNESIACNWNQDGVLIRHGGSSIIASCRVLCIFNTYNRVTFKEAFKIYSDRELPSWQSYQFNVVGFIEKDKATKEDLSNDLNSILDCDKWWCSTEKFAFWEKKIISIAKKSQAGFTIDEVDIPELQKMKPLVFSRLCKDGKLEKNGHLYNLPGQGEGVLTKSAKQLLQMAADAGLVGIEIDKINLPQVRKDARDLVTLNKLVLLEKFLYFDKKTYDTLVKNILKDRHAGELLSISDVREVTGLSRKYIIPILNCMEKDKVVRRDGNDRVIL